MGYSIKQVAEMLGLTAYTLRYYEKEGMLPFIERDGHGNRSYSDNDKEWIMLICCLRNTGMAVSEIKRYVALCMEGSNTIEVRRQIILQHKATVEKKIKQMNDYLVRIDKKLGYYDALVDGTGIDCCNPRCKSEYN